MRTPKAPAVEIGLLSDGVIPDAPPADAAPPVTELPAIPEPITAIDADGQHRPMSGGSFIRQSDGTLVRSDDNG